MRAIFAHYGGLPPIAALLASVSTITTIGLYVPNGGNFLTLNQTEAVFLIVMIIVSVGAAASTLQATVGAFINGDLAKGKVEEKLMQRLKNHVIVYGYGHLGKYVIEKLDELGLDYVVVTTDPQLYAGLVKDKTLAVLEHETRPIEALKQAGIEKAGMLIVSHQNDPDNMLITLSARKLRPNMRIVSVVHDSDLIDAMKSSGADMVIPSSVTIGHLLALSAATKDLVGIVFSEEIGTKEIARFTRLQVIEAHRQGAAGGLHARHRDWNRQGRCRHPEHLRPGVPAGRGGHGPRPGRPGEPGDPRVRGGREVGASVFQAHWMREGQSSSSTSLPCHTPESHPSGR